MKNNQIIALAMTGIMVVPLAGCNKKEEASDRKINISVGLWPDETQPENLAKQNKIRDSFMDSNPDINIITDTYNYDTQTFTMKSAAGQLPNMYRPWFTEIQKLIRAGEVADITDAMKSHGFDTAMNPELIKLASDENGRIYGVPTSVYAQGLYINLKLFTEAGLINADGTPKVPNTYQELADFAKIIKEKTGKAGFVIPTVNNCGGWHFLNIAWSYGVEFLKQEADGSWKAAFDTQEARDALQFVKDLKWKYNALPDETVIDQQGTYKIFGSYQAAMMFADPPCGSLRSKYGMDINDIFVTKMPEGPKGRYSQTGGDIWMFSKETTPEQIDAGLTWLEYTGVSPKISEEQLNNLRISYENTIKNNGIVTNKTPFLLWTDEERNAQTDAIRTEFTNVKNENYEQYYDFSTVTIKTEPEKCAQQLYAVLDKCIQEVITNRDADVGQLISEACEDFQKNHLDKEE